MEIKETILSKVGLILKRKFSQNERHEMILHSDRVNFACPICGDSASATSKKRGNIYFKTMTYHCYNCGYHTDVPKFLKRFDEELNGDDFVKVFEIVKANQLKGGNYADIEVFEYLNKYAITKDELCDIFGCHPVTERSAIYPYLKGRLLHRKLDKFAYDKRRNILYVLNLTPDDKVIGLQKRTFGDGSKYITYNIEKIYTTAGKTIDEPQEVLNELNRFSMLFGIMRINIDADITVFEGPIDSMFYQNSIALCGVKKQVPFLNELPNVKFLFDNDAAGKEQMIRRIKRGQRVFMWESFLHDHRLPKKIKDLNELVQYEYNHKGESLKDIRNYFSNNSLDMINI